MKKIILIMFLIILMTGCSNIECPKDSIKDNNKCYKFTYKDPEEKLTCLTDYELIDNKCIKTEKRKAQYINDCPNGYTMQNNSCIKVESTSFKVTKSCSGYYGLLIDDRCYSISNMEFQKYYYMCGADGTLESNYCSFVRKTSMDVNIYACNNKLSSYLCTKGGSTWLSNYYYGCDNVGLGGQEIEHFNMCYNRNLSILATINNVCPSGYKMNSNGNNCIRTLSTNTIQVYSCNAEEKLEDSYCVIRTETDAKLSPVCEEDYNLIEQQCIRSEEVEPIKND